MERKQQSRGSVLLLFLLFIVMIAATVVYWNRVKNLLSADLFLMFPFLYAAFLAVSLVVQNFLSAVGYILFGKLSGLRILKVSFFGLYKNFATHKKGVQKMPQRFGSYVIFAPPVSPKPFHYLPIFMGGSVLNAAAALAAIFGLTLSKFGSLSHLFFFCFLLISFVLIVLTMSPMKTPTNDTCGFKIRALKSSERARAAFLQCAKVEEALNEGALLTRQPEENFLLPPDGTIENTFEANLAIYKLLRLLSERLLVPAAELSQKLLKSDRAFSDEEWTEIRCIQIICALVGARDPSVFSQYLSKNTTDFMGIFKNSPLIICTNYAIEKLLNRNDLAAAQCVKKYLKVRPHLLYSALESDYDGIFALVDRVAALDRTRHA